MPLETLTVFRIEASVSDPDDIIIGREKLEHVDVRLGDERLGDLYIRRIARDGPRWAEYFLSAADFEGVALATASTAAVFLLSQGGRLYAFTFGFGRTLLNDYAIERRFGLRVVLNAVEPSQLRSIDHKRLEAISRLTREQLSKSGTLELFGVDTDRDLLRAVTGTPANVIHGKRLSGSDQLTFVAQVPLTKLREHVDLYASLAEETTYTTSFPWVDNVREVKEKRLKIALNAALVSSIQDGSSPCWIAPPDLVEWDKPIEFAYKNTKSAKRYSDLDISDYFLQSGAARDMTAVRLEADRIYCWVDGETSARSWPIGRCLIADCLLDGRKYVLNDGIWYEIEGEFARMVDAEIGLIPSGVIDLPGYNDSCEAKYNERAARRDRNNLVCLDRKLIQYPSRGKIEVCDLYTKSRQFVHVKRCTGSGTLSHLFSQGVVSAQLLVSDPGFRTEFCKLIPPSHHWGDPNGPLSPGQFEVCYAIVTHRRQPLRLPFFSKVSLRAAARNIRQLGMKVSLTEIPS